MLNYLKEHWTRNGACVVELSSRTEGASSISYGELWNEVRRQTAVKGRQRVEDESDFVRAVLGVLAASQNRFRVVLVGAERGNEMKHHELIGTFNLILGELARRDKSSLAVLAVDDYSLYYYLKTLKLKSDYGYFEKSLHLPLVAFGEIKAILQFAFGSHYPSGEVPRKLLDTICMETGGHLGLIADIIQYLSGLRHPIDAETAEADVVRRIRASHILELIGLALEEDAISLTQTAIEYREARTAEANTPRVHVLRSLGILVRSGPSSKLQLCGGAISFIVDERASATRDTQRIGTMFHELGPRIFEEEYIEPSDDDFVIVHISDLHCGEEQHRFGLSYQGRALNQGEPLLADLVSADINALKLNGRIDLLMVSGDVAEKGKAEEYDLAEAVLRDLCTKINLPVERMVVIPGNHDVDWTPGPAAVVDGLSGVTKHNYARFRRLLGLAPARSFELKPVISRSGRKLLRVAAFDSNAIEGPRAPGIGYIEPEAFAEMNASLSVAAPADYDGIFTWFLVHHHVLPSTSIRLKDALAKKVSVLGNSSELQHYATKMKVDLVAHGHEHQPQVTVTRTWPVESGREFAPLVVLGAGSVGSKDLGPFGRNQFYILHRRGDHVVIRSRCIGANGIGFVPHNDLLVPLGRPAVSKAPA